jgi:TRAP-type C4-dicarboxylate transport system permease small subunit
MERLIRRLEQAGMAVAVVCVVAIMLVVSADALGRYLFKSPLPVTFELVTFYLLVASIYMAVAATYRHGDHININLIQDKLPKSVRNAAEIAFCVLTVIVFALIAWGALQHSIEAYRRKEFIPGVIIWPVWLSYLPIPLGAALLMLRLLHHSGMLALRGGDPSVQAHAEEVVVE